MQPIPSNYWRAPISFLDLVRYFIHVKPLGPIYAITLTTTLADYQTITKILAENYPL